VQLHVRVAGERSARHFDERDRLGIVANQMPDPSGGVGDDR